MKKFIAIMWTLLIAIASILPVPEGYDKFLSIGHIFSYFILSILWVYAIGFNSKALFISIALTPLTEILQLIIPWRNSNIFDLGSNFLGVIIAFIIFYIFKKIMKDLK
ncbi:MAG: VanZ family protein [Nitrososphaerota archaeon]